MEELHTRAAASHSVNKTTTLPPHFYTQIFILNIDFFTGRLTINILFKQNCLTIIKEHQPRGHGAANRSTNKTEQYLPMYFEIFIVTMNIFFNR